MHHNEEKQQKPTRLWKDVKRTLWIIKKRASDSREQHAGKI